MAKKIDKNGKSLSGATSSTDIAGMNIPEHVAIILDGNGRWAKKKHLPRNAGHAAGARTVEKIIEDAHDLGIRYLTVYAFSTENWNRPEDEVTALMKLLRNYLKDCIERANKNDMKCLVIGDKTRLDKDIVDKINELEECSKNNKGITIIEMIVSISLISIVLIFLLRLLLTIKDMDDKSLSMIEYEEKTSLIMKSVQDSLKDLNNCTFNSNVDTLTITCGNSQDKITIAKEDLKITVTNCLEAYYNDKNQLTCPIESWTFADALQVTDINDKSSGNLKIFTIDVIDDKNNTYPIEISYYNK